MILFGRLLVALEPLGITAVEEKLFLLQSHEILTLVSSSCKDGNVVAHRKLERSSITQ